MASRPEFADALATLLDHEVELIVVGGADCHAAVRAAKQHYAQAGGCYHCSRSCDTG